MTKETRNLIAFVAWLLTTILLVLTIVGVWILVLFYEDWLEIGKELISGF